MNKRSFLGTTGLLGAAALAFANEERVGEGNAASLVGVGPYLQNVDDTGATVMWLTNVKCHSWVEWGETDALGKKAQMIVDGQVAANNTLNRIRLAGLRPGRRYFYRICSREITRYGPYKVEWGRLENSEIKSFETANPDSDALKCIFFNDIHDNLPLFSKLVEQVDGLDYDLSIFNGDCFNDPATEEKVLRSLATYNQGINAASTPVVYLRGNHEIRGAYSRQWPGLVDNPGGKQYFALSRGPVRFIFLDCGEDKADSHWAYSGLNDFEGFHREQAEWLEQEIVKPEFTQAKYRVLVHHIPIYGLNPDSFNPWKTLWGPILNRAGFDMSIHGHTHRAAIHPPHTAGDHNYPVIIGGGKKMGDGTVTILEVNKDGLSATILDAHGEKTEGYLVEK
ncbi:FN3 domain-containing metallophosphoesterase family protein [Pontiella sulfatireligans]|nr:FN3 domain-containing metallophosphoesterase family protein [Pontiella sulfatireligans]